MIKKVKIALNHRTTYRVGLLQSRAYRVLQQSTTLHLRPLGIGPIRWAFLGLLKDNPKGIKPSEAAESIGVEAPFITSMAKELEKKQLIEVMVNTKDSRSKQLILTSKGKKFIEHTEKYLRMKMRPLVKNISKNEFIDYLFVLSSIVENHKRKNKINKK